MLKSFAPCLVVIQLLLLGCGGESPDIAPKKIGPGKKPPKALAYEANAKGLEKLFGEIQTAITDKDVATAAKLTKDLFPDDESLGVAIQDADAIKKIKAMHEQFQSGSEKDIAGLFVTSDDRTQINVHAATTEEIKEYKSGGVAFSEFPGGARQLAKDSILKPNVTFYEVELVVPGEDAGMKYHLFYHDGENWKMIGPAWRAMR